MASNLKIKNGELDAAMLDLIEGAGGSPNADLIREIIGTALRLVEDQADRGDLKIINTALKEIRYAFRVFASYRGIRKISLFGSARIAAGSPEYVQAEAFAYRVARQGFMVITGAGDGIMRAAQGGAGRERSFGVNIRLPFEQRANEFIEKDSKLINFKYFFTRKLVFVKETDAIAVFPGGFGTLDEAFELLTLVQTGKSNPLPIVLIDRPGGTFWHDWREYVERNLLRRDLVAAEDMHLFRITDDIAVALDEIVRFYRNYHSSRYVHELLVVRMHRPAPPGRLAAMNASFGDILDEGEIAPTPTLPEEANEPEIAHLPRLALRFNRRNFGRLRQLIDALNTW